MQTGNEIIDLVSSSSEDEGTNKRQNKQKHTHNTNMQKTKTNKNTHKDPSEKRDLPTVTFKIRGLFPGSSHEVRMSGSAKLYDLALKLDKTHLYRTKIEGKIFGKILGRDILLSDSVKDHFHGTTVIFKIPNMGGVNPIHVLDVAIKLYERGDPHPPALNWYDADPLNLGGIGIWIGWGSGPTSVPKEDDNRIQNLIILEHANGVRRAYNAHMLLKALNNDAESKDPVTGKKVRKADIVEKMAGNAFLPVIFVQEENPAPLGKRKRLETDNNGERSSKR